jgi:hypothetical protein
MPAFFDCNFRVVLPHFLLYSDSYKTWKGGLPNQQGCYLFSVIAVSCIKALILLKYGMYDIYWFFLEGYAAKIDYTLLYLNERKKPPQHYSRRALRVEELLWGRDRLAPSSTSREVAALPGELLAKWKHLHRLEYQYADSSSPTPPATHPHQPQRKDVFTKQPVLPCNPVAPGERG